MKRVRNTSRKRNTKDTSPLTALEFAHVLQTGSAPSLVTCFRRFVQTVQRQKKQALVTSAARNNNDKLEEEDESVDSLRDDFSDASDDGDDDDDIDAAKKKPRYGKTESWKEDTANYQVPFVGTSTSIIKRPSLAERVQVNTWPTGLLKAYLQNSPLATELIQNPSLVPLPVGNLNTSSVSTSNIFTKLQRQKQHKVSQRLLRLYLKVLAELLSAAIPTEKLQQHLMSKGIDDDDNNNKNEIADTTHDTASDTIDNRFVPILVKDLVPSLFLLLHDQMDVGKSHQKHKQWKCGPLAAPIVHVLTALAATSVTNARHVTRKLHTSGRGGGGRVLSALLRPTTQKTTGTVTSSTSTTNPQDQDTVETNVSSSQTKTRTSAIRLTWVLLQYQDPVILSLLINNNNAKDRHGGGGGGGGGGGLLCLVLTEGLTDIGPSQSRAFYHALIHVLQILRRMVVQRTLSRRMITDLFVPNLAILKLCKAATFAPNMTEATVFESVIQAHDRYEEQEQEADLASIAMVGIHARRLLFVLLADAPHVLYLHHHESHSRAQPKSSIIVRTLVKIWEHESGLQVQRFVVHCLCSSPGLFPEFFKLVTLPDPSDTFRFIKVSSFLLRLARDGPCPYESAKTRKDYFPSQQHTKDPLASICSVTLKRQVLVKALNGKNSLVAFETLKLMMVLVDRLRRYQKVAGSIDKDMVTEFVTKRFPDTSMILAAAAKRDMTENSANALVMMNICGLVPKLLQVYGQQDQSPSLDWTKLLPGNVESFCRAMPSLQRGVLSCLAAILAFQEGGVVMQCAPMAALLEIMLCTSSDDIYRRARSLVHKVLCQYFGAKGESDEDLCISYEYECWLDGMTKDTLRDFCAVFQDTPRDSLFGLVALSRAWKSCGVSSSVPQLNVSPLLIYALQSLGKMSGEFVLLTLQVSLNCLLRHLQPLSLSSLICFYLDEDVTTLNRQCGLLKEYATRLISWHAQKSLVPLLFKVHRELFTSKSSFQMALGFMDDSREAKMPFGIPLNVISSKEANWLLRQISHCMLVASPDEKPHLSHFIRLLLPFAVKEWNGLYSCFTRFFGVPHNDSLSLLKRWSVIIILCSSGHADDRSFQGAIRAFSSFPNENVESSGDIFALLSLVLLKNSVPVETLPSLSRESLRSMRETVHSSPFLKLIGSLLACSLKRMRQSDRYRDGIFLGDVVLESWVQLTGSDKRGNENAVQALELEEFLCWLSETGTDKVPRYDLLSKIGELDAKNVVTLSMKSRYWAMQLQRDRRGPCILSSVVSGASDEYSLILLEMMASDKDGPRLTELLKSGYLDVCICTVLKVKIEGDTAYNGRIVLTKALLERAQLWLERPLASEDSIDTISACLASAQLPVEDSLLMVYEDLQDLMRKFDFDRLSLGVDQIQAVVRIAVSISSCNETEGSVKILERVLCFCLTWLANLTTSITCKSDPTRLLSCISSTKDILRRLRSSELPPTKFVPRLREVTEQLISFGLAKGAAFESMKSQIAALDLVEALVSPLNVSEELERKRVELNEKDFADYISSVLIANSDFNRIMQEKEEGEPAAKVKEYILRILVQCWTVSPPIKPDDVMLRNLLQSFEAGLSNTDRMVRVLLHKYAKFVPLCEFRWKSVLRGPSTQSSEWAWLPESMDIRRVRATLANFDISDPLRPVTFENRNKKTFGRVLQSLKSTAYLLQTERSWRRSKYEPYSPGFLLPLILAALDDSKEDGECIGISQSLCDKGALALALASLCSRCDSLRRISLSVLHGFYDAVESEAARNVSSWKERPQIAMMLRSVHLGLTIRTSNRGLSREGMPKIAGVSALFLARASLILCNPGDDMFPAINRIFLQSEVEHGAFRDLNRLPAFVSLFCSSADESSLASRHRTWITQIIRDGFLDEDSYKPVAACHAPELLLTSIDSLRLTSRSGEVSVLLSAITAVLEAGGDKCEAHLIDRLGLFYWLRALTTGRPVAELFDDAESQLEFLRLADIVVTKSSNLVEKDEIEEIEQAIVSALRSGGFLEALYKQTTQNEV